MGAGKGRQFKRREGEGKSLQRLGPPHWSASALLETGSQSGYVRQSHLGSHRPQLLSLTITRVLFRTEPWISWTPGS